MVMLSIYLCSFAVICVIIFILYMLLQMRSFKRTYQIVNKPISEMNKKEILFALQSEELNTIRWVEDLIELLIRKGMIESSELPIPVQERLSYKKELRIRLLEFKGE